MADSSIGATPPQSNTFAPGLVDAADEAVALVRAVDLMARGLEASQDREAFYHVVNALDDRILKINAIVCGEAKE